MQITGRYVCNYMALVASVEKEWEIWIRRKQKSTFTTNFRNNTVLSILNCSTIVSSCLLAAWRLFALYSSSESINFINGWGTTSTEIQTCRCFSNELWPQQCHMIFVVRTSHNHVIKINSNGQTGTFTKGFIYQIGILSTTVSWTLLTVANGYLLSGLNYQSANFFWQELEK